MGKSFIKYGKVVIITHGRHAGKKAIVIRSHEDGTKDKKFAHALVAGIKEAPKKVSKRMGSKKIKKRTQVKPFVKFINLNHIMPTRYTISQTELELKDLVKEDKVSKPETRQELNKELKAKFEDKYRNLPASKGLTGDKTTAHIRFFFRRLRF